MRPDLRAWAAAFAGLLAATLALAQPAKPTYRAIPGGTIKTLLPPDGKQAPVTVPDFAMRVLPVTHAEFARFVQRQPHWRKSHAAHSSLADGQYLKSWPTDIAPMKAQRSLPVTDVSWFAADAYCQSEQARLPTWHQWEYAAAADEKRADARTDPLWRARILDWYGQTSRALPR
jgi:formylglycine-generating enzyme